MLCCCSNCYRTFDSALTSALDSAATTERYSMQRVKVYRLTADGQWDDKGTGKVSVEWMEVGCAL